MLSDDEATAVVVGLAIAEHRGLAGAGGALAKIARVLPERLNRRVERLRDEVSFSGEPSVGPPTARRDAAASSPRPCGGGARSRSTTRAATARRAIARSSRSGSSRAAAAGTSRPATARAASCARSAPTGSAAPTIGDPASPRDPELRPGGARRPRCLRGCRAVADRGARARAGSTSSRRASRRRSRELTPDGGRNDALECAPTRSSGRPAVLAGLGAEFGVVRPDELREHVRTLAGRLAAAGGPAA